MPYSSKCWNFDQSYLFKAAVNTHDIFDRKSVEVAELLLDGTVGVTVNKATGSEIEASNGVIHAMDSVLMPPKA